MTFTRRITALLACLMFATSGQAVPIRRLPGQKLPDNYYRTERDNPAVWAPERSYAYTRGAAPGDYAINDSKNPKGSLWIGYCDDLEIDMYLDSNKRITTAYPVYEGD